MENILETLLEKLEEIKVENTHLYFITRVLKPDKKKTEKVLDKYDFKVYQIDVDDEIREHLHTLTKDQLFLLAEKKSEISEYDVITDDTHQLLTYAMKNKGTSFSDVVNKQLTHKSEIPKISNLEEIILTEELWAYCVGFLHKKDDWIYTFRKILSGKVAVDEQDSNTKTKFQKFLRAKFNSKSTKLELIEGETVNLDKQVDCIYYNHTFYIAHKTQFEQIVGLEAEFKEQATDVVTELENTKMIEGLEIMSAQIESNPAIHKKLVRLYKLGNYRELTPKIIKKMEAVAKEFEDKLKTKNGKLHIEDEADVDLVLKMLAEYYKEGKIFGKFYGTYSGKVLTSKK